AGRVIVDSEFGRDEVVDLLRVPAAKVRVIPLGVSAEFVPVLADAPRGARALPEGYLLYVGARKRAKNLELLLRALAAIPAGDRPPLVLSGTRWRDGEPLARLAARLEVADRVHFSGGVVSDRELAGLYAGAALYV